MNTREYIVGAALCTAAGLWIGTAFAGTEEARADSSACSVNIRLCDVDILHLSSKKSRTDEYWGHSAFCIQASHGQTFENLLFEKIRVAATEMGDNFLVARTMPINPGFRYHMGFSFDEPGHVTNLVFRNVTVGGNARPAIYLESHDAKHAISGFRFENVTGCAAPRCVDREGMLAAEAQ